MDWGTILVFLILSIGIGSNVFFLIKKRNIYEMVLLSLVSGLALLPPLLFLMSLLHIPLDIRVFIVLAVIGPAIGIFRSKKIIFKIPPTRAYCLAAVLIGVIFLTQLMFTGAEKYPWLENDDPWDHAIGAKYVAVFKSSADSNLHYLEPYPPYYTTVMGLLHQTTPDLKWVLKFFNALIVGLSLLAAFFVFEVLTNSQIKATVAALVLGMIPAYMSHFIWAQTLSIPVFFMALWALAQVKNEKKKKFWQQEFFVPAVIFIWGATITQPSTAIYFAIFFVLYAAVKTLLQKFTKKRINFPTIYAVLLGGALSLVSWMSFMVRYGAGKVFDTIGVTSSMFFKNELLKKIFGGFFNVIGLEEFNKPLGDTGGGIVYTLKDIIFAPTSSKIDQATGLGWLVALLAVIGLVLLLMNWKKIIKEKNSDSVFVIFLLFLTFLALEAEAFAIKLFPHRVWVLFAIPVALLVAHAIVILSKSISRKKTIQYGIIVLVTLVVLMTNFEPRTAVQQAQWPPGVSWSSQDELDGYVQMENDLPIGSGVFAFCDQPSKAIGFNFNTDFWNSEQDAFKNSIKNKTGQETVAFLQLHNYQYFVISPACLNEWGLNETQEFVNEMSQTGKIIPIVQSNGFLVGQVN